MAGAVPLCVRVSFASPGIATIVVVGDVDLATAPTLGIRMLAVMQDHHPAVVELDLSEVTFLDCAGIRVLVAVRNTAVQAHCQLWVSSPQSIVALILTLTGLLTVWTRPNDRNSPRLAPSTCSAAAGRRNLSPK
jgi:anti-anti-sigma factor